MVMNALLQVLFSNVVAAAVLALVVFVITRVWRNPHLAHGLWLLVLLKLVTPPLFQVPLPILEAEEEPEGEPGTRAA